MVIQLPFVVFAITENMLYLVHTTILYECGYLMKNDVYILWKGILIECTLLSYVLYKNEFDVYFKNFLIDFSSMADILYPVH